MSLLTPGRTFIIAEVGLAHDGSLGNAHAYIDAVAKAGVDAVKFQARSTGDGLPNEYRVPSPWPQDRNRHEFWLRTAFDKEQWVGLKTHAHQSDLRFILSAFNPQTVRDLDRCVDAWKIASGEVTHTELLEAIKATGKPVI